MLAHSFYTDIGRLSAVEYEGRLVMLLFGGRPPEAEEGTSPVLLETERQIREYLSGIRMSFELPLGIRFSGFRKDVTDAMMNIPYGSTMTYGQLAEASGHPGASRAAGSVCRKNPLPLIIPCHRVIPSSGGIGNYSGPEGMKEKLLTIEERSLKGASSRPQRKR